MTFEEIPVKHFALMKITAKKGNCIIVKLVGERDPG